MGKHAIATQVAHPTRAAIRTGFQGFLALCVLAPLIIEAAGLGTFAWAASIVAVTAAITRVFALPGVNAFIADYVPWLAPLPKAPSAVIGEAPAAGEAAE